jgi:putative redox protein
MFEYELKNGAAHLNTQFGELIVSADPEKGFKPIELLVSSLVGCSGGILETVLKKKRIEYDSIRVQTNIERNKEKANRVERIDFHYIIEGKNLKEEQVQKSLDMTLKYCGMIQTVIGSVEVHETFELINHPS